MEPFHDKNILKNKHFDFDIEIIAVLLEYFCDWSKPFW